MTTTSHRPDRLTLTAFVLVILLGGGNSVAIRFSNMELAPFWGACIRFVVAGGIYWLLLWGNKMKLPSRKVTAVLFVNGFLALGGSFALLYWALLTAPISLATVLISMGPLFTMLLAILHRLEKFRWQTMLGGLIAVVGIAVAVNAQPSVEGLLPAILALIAGALISAEGNVLFKMFSADSDPIVLNAVTMSAGALFLGTASLIAGEVWSLPTQPEVWTALVYLILGGSLAMFYMFVYVIKRWTASAASYAILFFPLVATVLAAWLANETVTPLFLLGGGIVIAGVWVGAFFNSEKA
jgi:drug/metabolite transporter (DMT)-like permease